MKNVKTLMTIFAFAIPVVFLACTKESIPANNDITAVKLSFTGNQASPKLHNEGSTVDLSKAATVKMEYTIEDGSNQIQQVRKAELTVAGNNSKVSTIDHRVLSFKGGSKITILSAALLDANGNVIATIPVPDTFKINSPQGILIMEKSYEATGLER